MKPPPDARIFVTELSTFWIDEDGILCTVSKNTERTLEKQKKTFELVKKVIGNKKVCLLAEITNLAPQDKETRDYVALETPKMFKATATISNSVLSRFIVKIFLTLKGQSIPTKMFDDEHKAKEWLKQYL